MRHALASLLVALVLGATSAFAVCGDGVLQAGETCDGSTHAACLGDCIPPGLAGQCTCATPSTDPRDFALIADSRMRLGTGSIVISGHVGVVNALGEMKVGKDVVMPGSSEAIAVFARLLAGARVGRLFSDAARVKPGALVTNGGPFFFDPPLTVLAALPPLGPATPGTTLVDVPVGETLVLPPGAYGTVLVEQGGTLILRGLSPGSGVGTYDLQVLRVGYTSRVLAHNPVVVNASEKILLTALATIDLAPATSLIAGDIQLNVLGKRVGLAHGASVAAHIRAPNANVRLGRGAFVTGRIIGETIATANGAIVSAQGACGDGFLDPEEQCDASAPSGDAACPGACIAGDPQGQGRIALGQPGQCTCRCGSDAQCDDGDACNGRETCENTICVVGIPPDCNDDNPCTRDCDAALGCVNAPVADGTPCDEDNACTEPDSCQGGTCVPGPPVLDGTSCSDQNKCTVLDACQAGACVAGPARDCSDDNTCSVDTCDEVAGCRHTLLHDDDPCSDGSVCTLLDRCLHGACVGSGQKNCDDGNPCTAESCDATDGCLHTPLPDGTSCASGKTCRGGFCP